METLKKVVQASFLFFLWVFAIGLLILVFSTTLALSFQASQNLFVRLFFVAIGLLVAFGIFRFILDFFYYTLHLFTQSE
jgi:uncharacterized membrane protein